MGLGLQPVFKLIANDKNISDVVAGALSSLRVSLESDHTSDELFIELSDNRDTFPIKTPKTGAVLSLSLGYGNDLTYLGDYVASGVERSGGAGIPTVLGITARAAPYAGTPRGATEFQTQKTRSWWKNTTIGAMVTTMAKEHGMEGVVSASLAGIHLQHLDQTDESDISFLVRLARHYDAIAKPAGGKLLFVSRGDSLSASGQKLPTATLAPTDVSSWRWTEDRHITPGTVVACYHATKNAKTYSVSIGSGDPVRQLKRKFRTAEDARAAATAEMARRARGAVTLSVAMRGNAKIMPGMTVTLAKEFGEDESGDWLVKRVLHDLGGDNGFQTEINFERPNTDTIVQGYLNGTVNSVALERA